MKDSLKPGLTYECQYKVPEDKTVPYLFPEFEEGQVMPVVLASGYMVGLFEFACIKALTPHLDWPREQTVGIGFNLDHTAATPPGFIVTIKITLSKIEGRKLTFSVEAHDGVDPISKGTHDRFVINAEKFKAGVEGKMKKHFGK
jgi:fluoroacetyl-CoA thioesterase